jgi:dethiobiotin synthetase
MTADPPEATPRPRLSLVAPPPRPERGSGGHGLPVATPAPARILSAVPDPLQAHGGGHRPVPHPVPAAHPADGGTNPNDTVAVPPNSDPTAQPNGDHTAQANDWTDNRIAARPDGGSPAQLSDQSDDRITEQPNDWADGRTAAQPYERTVARPDNGAAAWSAGVTGADPRTEVEPHDGTGLGDGIEAEPNAVPEPEETSSDDTVTPSGVPNTEETVSPAEPEADGEPEASGEPESDREAAADREAESEREAESDREPAANPDEWHGIVLVTGTDTEVGKTIATAAMAAAAQAAGLRVAVIKPGQTGIATGAPTDADVITRLAGPDTVRTLAEYPEPLAPLAAAKVAGLPPLDLYDVVDAIRAEAVKHDLVLVEGAGGLLVPMGLRPSGEAWTFADLATTLGSGMIVVARAGLGTLNHTALTLEALTRRGVHARVILGAWPAEPELVHWANLGELVPHLVGALPAGAGSMDPGVFRRSAPGWLTPPLHGVLDNWRVWAEEAG